MAIATAATDHGLHSVAITDHVEYVSRRLARTWSTVAVAVFVVLGLTIGVPHGPDLEAWERQSQLATLVFIGIGTLVAWKWEGVGGSMLLFGSTSLGVLAALQHQPILAFLPAATFLIPAIAFLVAWHRTRTITSVLILAAVLAVVLVSGSLIAQTMYDHGFGAAHPQSGLPDLPRTPVVWMWSGAVTATSAVVVARVDTAATVTLELSTGTLDKTRHSGQQTDGVWRFELRDLAPATGYAYVLEVDGRRVDDRTGEFTTFPAGPASFTIAVGSCARLGSNGVVYETIRNLEPDLFLIPGDFFYADHIETLDQFAAAYNVTLTSPAQAALLAKVPVAYVWDDHDYGRNDADSTTPTRDLARTAFSINVPHYQLTGSGTINQAFTLGRARFLLLDNRSARDPKSAPDGPGKTMLGHDQFDWLETQLLDANGKYPLIVIVTSVPWITEAEDGADHWGGYTVERARLADFIAANDITGLLMVAGDAHMVAIDDGSNTNYSVAGNATFPLLHAAALDRPGSAKGGPYSEGAYPGGGQFGLIEVTDTGTGQITVQLSGLDWTGARIVEYSFPVVAPDLSP